MIIALTGKKRSGKDTAGNWLIQYENFIKYSFAEPIKELCKIVFLWDERHTEGILKEVVDKRWGISPREAFQIIGTDLFREKFPELHGQFKTVINDKIWIQRFLYWYTEHSDYDIVITDLRFLNEAHAIKQLGGNIVKIDSPVGNNDTHKSELEMEQIKYDYCIDNKEYSIEYIETEIMRYVTKMRWEELYYNGN